MNAIADRYADLGVGSIFIYTREAHPGEYYPHLASMEQNFSEVNEQRRSGERVAPFRLERLDFRIQDRDAFYEGLARNGPKAVREFRAAFE